MTHRSLVALIVINAVLLAGMAWTALSPREAHAQFGAQTAYLMIAGEAVGRTQQNAVYVINLTTADIAPLFFNTSNNSIDVFRGRNVGADAGQRGGGGK